MTQLSPSAAAYLRTKVMSASPAELRMMLLDGAVKFVRQGREGLAGKNYEQAYNGFSQARNIIMELINAIRPEVDPVMCGNVNRLYTFIYLHLVEGAHEKDFAKIDKVIELLEYERETWILLMEKLAAEEAAPALADAAPAGPPQRAAINVQG